MLPVWRRTLNLCTVPKWRNWQTRVVQVHVLARVWGFESLLRHQISIKSIGRLENLSDVWGFPFAFPSDLLRVSGRVEVRTSHTGWRPWGQRDRRPRLHSFDPS